MTPVIRIVILSVLAFYFTACGSKSGNSAGPLGAQTEGEKPADDGRMKLKAAGVKKVMIGTNVDLSKYLLNSDGATYSIIEGASSVAWASTSKPILRIAQGGDISILVQDEQDLVTLKLRVVFDTTGLVIEPGSVVTLPPVDTDILN